MKTKPDYYKIFGYIVIPINIILIALLIFDYFGKLPSYWSSIYVFFLLLIINTWFLALKINRIPESEREDNSVVYLSKYFFLLGLIILTINQFFKRNIIIQYQNYLIGLIIALGFLTFYSSKNRVEKEIEEEKQKEENFEKKREEEFASKFPFINKIPILRSIVKWGYKEGWACSVSLIFIIIITSIIKLRIINNMSFYVDEGLYVYLIEGIKNYGIPLLDTGKIYLRGFLHTYLSWFFSFFFPLETSIRLPSFIFGVLLILSSYYILKEKISSKILLIISLGFISFNPYFLFWSIQGRFYIESLFWLSLFYYFYVLKGKNNFFTILLIPVLAFQSNFFNLSIIAVIFFMELFNGNLFNKKFLLKITLTIILILFYWFFLLNFLDSHFMLGVKNLEINDQSLKISLDIDNIKVGYYFDILKTLSQTILILYVPFLLSKFFINWNNFKRNFNQNKHIYVLIIFIVINAIFVVFFTDWYRVRYFLILYYALFLLGIHIIDHGLNILNNKKLLKKLTIFLLIIALYVTSQYPSYIGCSNKTYISLIDIYKEYSNENYDYVLSTATSSSAVNFKEDIELIKKNCINQTCNIFSTDLYNVNAYFIDLKKQNPSINVFIINDFLRKRGHSIQINENYFSSYSLDNKYILNTDQIYNITNQNKSFFIIRKSSIESQNPPEYNIFIQSNYDKVSTHESFTGCIYGHSIDSYTIYSN